MYRVTHGEDVYDCLEAELESDVHETVNGARKVMRLDYGRHVRLKRIIRVNGVPTHLDYAEKSVYVTQPFTITIAEEV